MVSTYSKFLNVIKAVKEATPEWPKLDANEERLLDALAMEWNGYHTVTVLEAIAMMPDVSESTMHRRLMHLVDKGVIQLEVLSSDRRIKAVTPTALTLQYFSQLSAGFNSIQQ
jgi:DNA-binding Lrp family transcriptional regulator